MDTTDEALMVSYQNGDETAFRVLYERYAKRVYGYLNKRVPKGEQVDEMFQSVFMKLHRSRDQYDPKYRFAPWLFTICRTTLIDAARTHKIYDEARFEPIGEVKDGAKAADQGVPQVDLSDLPEEQAQAVQMRYLEEMSFKEIADKLGSNSQTIRKRVSRAIQRLRKLKATK